MTPAPRQEWRATSLQKSMLLASMKRAGAPAYTVQRAVPLPAGTTARSVTEAWRDIVARHDMLRAQFAFSSSGAFFHLLASWDGSTSFRAVEVARQEQLKEEFLKSICIDNYTTQSFTQK